MRPRPSGAPSCMAEPLADVGDDDDDTLWIHELIGAEVVGVDGRSYGAVEAVEANPASDLLVLPGANWCRWCSW